MRGGGESRGEGKAGRKSKPGGRASRAEGQAGRRFHRLLIRGWCGTYQPPVRSGDHMKHTLTRTRPHLIPHCVRAHRTAGSILWFVCWAALLVLVVPAGAQETAQADRGADTFFFYCSTCHGRQGEGLTEAFRSQMPPGESNCWQSKCHAPNHPPEGFVFPKYVPALIGYGTLGAFDTAQDLYDFIGVNMPFQIPGQLQ